MSIHNTIVSSLSSYLRPSIIVSSKPLATILSQSARVYSKGVILVIFTRCMQNLLAPILSSSLNKKWRNRLFFWFPIALLGLESYIKQVAFTAHILACSLLGLTEMLGSLVYMGIVFTVIN